MIGSRDLPLRCPDALTRFCAAHLDTARCGMVSYERDENTVAGYKPRSRARADRVAPPCASMAQATHGRRHQPLREGPSDDGTAPPVSSRSTGGAEAPVGRPMVGTGIERGRLRPPA